MAKVILNGKVIDEEEAKISILDKGYFFDFAVYSSIKVIKGKIFFPECHVDRLFESAKIIGLKHNFSKEEVLKWMRKLVEIEKINDALLRIILIGDPDNEGKEKLFVFKVSGLTFYPDKFYKNGVKVITFEGERLIPRSKTKNLLLNFLALREAKRKGALEALLIDRNGNILEGTRSNFFAIKGNKIFTPPSKKVLEGVTRKIVFKATKKIFEIKEADIPLKKIKNFEETFLASTTMNVMPIRQIDEIIFNINFEKTRLIQKLFKNYCKKKLSI